MPNVAEHKEWLSLIDVSGPFLTLPVLNEKLPHGLDALEDGLATRLRLAWEEKAQAGTEAAARAFMHFVLAGVLGYDEEVLRSASEYGDIRLFLPEFQEELRPDYVLAPPAEGSFSLDEEPCCDEAEKKPVLLVAHAPGKDPERALSGSGCPWSPARRMAELCRASGVPLGLACGEEKYTLVYAAKNRTTSYITWDAGLWLEERITLRAFVTLLCKHRFFSLAEEESLTRLMEQSAEKQQEVTDKLGLQVRGAMTEFLRALDALDRANGGALVGHIAPGRVYDAALTVMMRLVFLLSAEERGLMLLGDEVYDSAYAASTLYESLREEADRFGEELLTARHDAWVRLLALFRAVYGGVTHDRLRLQAYGGSLFDPDAYPFLEGRAEGSSWKRVEARPLAVDNKVILHMLESVLFLRDRATTGVDEAVRLSFRALDVEQIGHVYEGLLDRTARRAPQVLLGLKYDKKAAEPWLPLEEAERLRAEGEEAFFSAMANITGLTAAKVKSALAGEGRGRSRAPDEQRMERKKALLRRVLNGDEALENRILPFLGLLREDGFERPLVVPEGGLYVTAGSQRRDTGTHYTPRPITESLVAATLEPHVYEGPAQGLPRAEWKLKDAESILALRVCDMTMGSGAFLVQVCRYLAERLTEAWEKGAPGRDVPADAEERLFLARRLVADNCLYGVDNNPMAVEMAKLSLWLTTMWKNRPFTFLDHALRTGDALMGISSMEEIKEFSLNRGETQQYLFGFADMQNAVNEALESRRGLEVLRSDSILNVERKAALLDKAEAATHKLRLRADALVMATVAARGALSLDSREKLMEELLAPHFSTQPEALEAWVEARRRRLVQGSGKALAQKDEDANPGFTRPFHWALEFPEIFEGENPGFDVLVGNPPFKGSQLMREDLGNFYREYLVNILGSGVRGKSDLTAYFFLRASRLVRRGGDFGLIATNSIAQGDTREVGLLQLEREGYAIRAAWPDVPWEGNATVTTSQIILRRPGGEEYAGSVLLGDVPVEAISSFLKVGQEEWEAKPLKENAGIAFQGSIILGEGFLTTEEQARQWMEADAANREVLFPYLIGADVTSDPEQRPSRWIINFFDWSESRARMFSLPFSYLFSLHGINKNKTQYKNFWQYWRPRSECYHALGRGDAFERHSQGWKPCAALKTVLVASRVSKYGFFVMVPNTYVMSEGLCVFASDDYALFGLLQTSLHHAWARKMCSTMRSDLRYTPSSAFDTFPRPEASKLGPVRTVAEELHGLRAQVMKREGMGLTALYNHLHNPESSLPGAAELRRLHEELDKAAAAAYGWSNLDMSHDFREVGYLPDNDNVRRTIAEPVRLEVLRRLTLLNKERFEKDQAAAPAEKTGKKRTRRAPARQGSLI